MKANAPLRCSSAWLPAEEQDSVRCCPSIVNGRQQKAADHRPEKPDTPVDLIVSKSDLPLSFSAIAILAAGAFLTVVHRAVFTGLLAARLVRRKGGGAKECYQNRKQSLRIFHHNLFLLSATDHASARMLE